jgi:threonine dehydrogenase-like Zn-dependent dehydrogenase
MGQKGDFPNGIKRIFKLIEFGILYILYFIYFINFILSQVPGHEIGGVVTAVGPNVTKFTVGQTVGFVGCIVDSCRDGSSCKLQNQQYCSSGMVFFIP